MGLREERDVRQLGFGIVILAAIVAGVLARRASALSCQTQCGECSLAVVTDPKDDGSMDVSLSLVCTSGSRSISQSRRSTSVIPVDLLVSATAMASVKPVDGLTWGSANDCSKLQLTCP